MTRLEALDLHMRAFDEWFEVITEDLDDEKKLVWNDMRPKLLMTWKASYVAGVFK